MTIRRAVALLLALASVLMLVLIPAAVAEETIPEDGIYVPDAFSFSGGTGRVTISCPEVRVSGGEIRATLVFSSPNYPTLQVGGERYTATHEDGDSRFDVPAVLNADMEIIGTTTAMSTPHDIRYTVRIGFGEAAAAEAAEAIEPEDAGAKPEAPAGAASAGAGEAFCGLKWESEMPLEFAEGFRVNYYEGGFTLIEIAEGDTLLVLPEGAEPPAGLDPGIIVLRKPLQNIYLAATSAMALFDRLDALDVIGLSSQTADHWSIENAARAMEEGRMRFAGKYSEPDYELLLSSGCDLAIESTMIFHTPKVREMIEQLGIPVMVDRSSYEEHPLARTEWIKLYAALLGREAQAEAFFEERARVIDAYAGYPNTEKTVAFFYVSTDGFVVVRSASDYVPKMIGIAGGRYALKDIAGDDGEKSSVAISMEQFYSAALEADYLIYNASVAAPLNSLEDLFALSPLFQDFRAVQAGNVWCTGKDLYQETDDVGELIADIHNMLAGEGEMRFLTRVA